MNQGIYVITNIESSKFYVGSAKNLRKRWAHHRNRLRKNRHENSHLQHAWNKYSETAFRFGILESLDNPEELHLAEQFWMDVYREEDKELYNCGLAARSPWLGEHHTEKTRHKISCSKKGSHRSTETKAKIAAAHAKPYPAFYNERTGKIIPEGVNLRALCREQNLNPSHMCKVIMGYRHQHKDWRLASEKEIQ